VRESAVVIVFLALGAVRDSFGYPALSANSFTVFGSLFFRHLAKFLLSHLWLLRSSAVRYPFFLVSRDLNAGCVPVS